jgi:hypothetical protein
MDLPEAHSCAITQRSVVHARPTAHPHHIAGDQHELELGSRTEWPMDALVREGVRERAER